MEDRLNVIGNALEAIYNTAVSNEQRSAASQVGEGSSLFTLCLIPTLFFCTPMYWDFAQYMKL